MGLFSYFLTKKITGKVVDAAAEDAARTDSTGKMRLSNIYRTVFLIGAAAGIVIGLLCIYFGQIIAGLIIMLLFGTLSVPGLLMAFNCLLTFDKDGFTWRNCMRMSRRYSYEDITGCYDSLLRLTVELEGHKQLNFDEGWVNRFGFADAIDRYSIKKPPKLPEPILGMSVSEIGNSYKYGVLGRAMIVKESEGHRFKAFKCIHYIICTISILIAVFSIWCFPAFDGEGMPESLALLGLPGIVMVFLSLYLYFRYPQYFSAREMPGESALPRKSKVMHKRCTIVVTSLACLPGAMFFFVYQVTDAAWYWPVFKAAVMAVLVFLAQMYIFRRKSWEYRNFKLGYISYGFCQVLICTSLFFLFGGILCGIFG